MTVPSKSSWISNHRRLITFLFWAAFLSIVVFLLLYRLNSWPPVWWDEGWTLSAVRNWILNGHLGNYRDGVAIPPGIPLRFPVAVPVAISMKLFGIGTWQGRLPGVVFTVLALAMYGYIVSKMYDRRTGVATLVLLVCLSPNAFQPIIFGRQVLAEIPMMFYLLGGYTLLWLALTKSAWWSAGAVILFGIGMHAKLQVPPFWLVSIVLAIWLAIKHRQWRSTKILAWVTAGSILIAAIVYLIQNSIMPGSFNSPELLYLLINLSVVTIDGTIRWKAMYTTVIFALPELLGYLWAGRLIIRNIFAHRIDAQLDINSLETNREILKAAIWGLGASWMVWYITMSMYWIRYIFPAYMIGLIFVSAFVGKHTNGYDIQWIFRQISALLFKRELNRPNIKAAAIVIAFSIALAFAIGTMRLQLAPSILQPETAAAYLRSNIPDGAKVETYESELFFLAPELNYHFPPDLVSMQLYWRANIDRQYPINYDPLKSNPEYLIVGPYAQSWGVYDDTLIQKSFELIEEVGGYKVYRIKNSQLGN
jgi:4-amino-4-deoxy-L-arabinose transferase-like glycosyltransferase